jgi:hypothetical protein
MKKNKFYTEHNGMPLNVVRRRVVNELNELIYGGVIELQPVRQCFCGSKNFELLSRFDRYGLPFGTQICRNCGLISQTINIAEESMALFYDQIYWRLIYGTEEEFEYSTQLDGVDEFIPFLYDQIHFESNNIKILEIGVGQGNRIEALGNNLKNRYSLELYGSDYSTEALKNVRKKGIKTIQGGLDKCLDVGPIDILIMSHVFEHFVDIKASLNLIEKLTHDETLIYVEVPGLVDLTNKPEYMYDYQDYSVLAHIHNFSLGSLANIFSRYGFKLIKGTEYVRAVFSKNVENPQPVSRNPYLEIMDALKRAREKHLNVMEKINNPIRKYAVNLAKAALGRVSD